MELHELKTFIESVEKTLDELAALLDIEALKKTIESLESKTYEQGFWDDHEAANKVIIELKRHKQTLNRYETILEQLEDLKVNVELIELGEGAIDLDASVKAIESALEAFETTVYLSEPYDHLHAIVEIHPGAGGTESQDWALMLYRMITRYAERQNYTVDLNDYQEASEAGVKSVTMTLAGDYAFGHLKAEAGVHRLVRISPFDASGRRHTSFASVNVIPQIDDTIEVEIDDNDLKIDTYRSSGAGGQSVNTTDSAVRITHLPTKLTVTCQNERSQLQNRQKALQILKGKLYQRKLEEQKEAIESLRNVNQSNAFGSQIRSYVMHPYNMVKDHRTDEETGNVQKVLDGDLDKFIRAYLKTQASREATS